MELLDRGSEKNGRVDDTFVTPPKPLDKLKFISTDDPLKKKIQTLQLINEKVHINWINVRPIPDSIGWFETVWRDFKDKKIYD